MDDDDNESLGSADSKLDEPLASFRVLPPPMPLIASSNTSGNVSPKCGFGACRTITHIVGHWPGPEPLASSARSAELCAFYDDLRRSGSMDCPGEGPHALPCYSYRASPRQRTSHLPAGNDPDGQTLRFDSDFESGNLGAAVRIFGRCVPTLTPNEIGESGRVTVELPDSTPVDQEYDCWLRTDMYTTGNTQWYYFSVAGARPGLRVRFNLVNLLKPDSQVNYGMRPVVHEGNAVGWRRAGTDLCYYMNCLSREQPPEDGKKPSSRRSRARYHWTLSFTYEFQNDNGGEVFFAHCYPYTYTDLQRHLRELESDPARRVTFRRRELCKTLAGNVCDCVTITKAAEDPGELIGRRAIVITARVHPGETNSSFMMQGMLNFLTGPSLSAQILRENFVFKVVPMLNPDGVIVGNYRCSLACTDLNRRYAAPRVKYHPTIFHTKRLVSSLCQSRGVFLYCDLHGHSRKKNIFFYGCSNAADDEAMRVMVRQLPIVMTQISPAPTVPRVMGAAACVPASGTCGMFSYSDCHFKVQRSKGGTGRVVMYKEFGIVRSFTMEASFCGAGQNTQKRRKHASNASATTAVGQGVDSSRQSRASEGESNASTNDHGEVKGLALCNEIRDGLKHFHVRDLERAGRLFCLGILKIAGLEPTVDLLEPEQCSTTTALPDSSALPVASGSGRDHGVIDGNADATELAFLHSIVPPPTTIDEIESVAARIAPQSEDVLSCNENGEDGEDVGSDSDPSGDNLDIEASYYSYARAKPCMKTHMCICLSDLCAKQDLRRNAKFRRLLRRVAKARIDPDQSNRRTKTKPKKKKGGTATQKLNKKSKLLLQQRSNTVLAAAATTPTSIEADKETSRPKRSKKRVARRRNSMLRARRGKAASHFKGQDDASTSAHMHSHETLNAAGAQLPALPAWLTRGSGPLPRHASAEYGGAARTSHHFGPNPSETGVLPDWMQRHPSQHVNTQSMSYRRRDATRAATSPSHCTTDAVVDYCRDGQDANSGSEVVAGNNRGRHREPTKTTVEAALASNEGLGGVHARLRLSLGEHYDVRRATQHGRSFRTVAGGRSPSGMRRKKDGKYSLNDIALPAYHYVSTSPVTVIDPPSRSSSSGGSGGDGSVVEGALQRTHSDFNSPSLNLKTKIKVVAIGSQIDVGRRAVRKAGGRLSVAARLRLISPPTEILPPSSARLGCSPARSFTSPNQRPQPFSAKLERDT